MNHSALWYNKKPVGKAREKLAEKVQKFYPDYDVQGRDFIPQAPAYLGAMSGMCVWTASFRHRYDRRTPEIHLHSWDRMTRLAKSEIDIRPDGEVVQKDAA